MDFFVLPKELLRWIDDFLTNSDHWILAWKLRPSVYSIVDRVDDPILSRYAKKEDGELQLFIGNRKIQRGPVMMVGGDGRERIDFRNSLCIQVVPSFVVGKILVEGSVGTLNPKEYKGLPGEAQFMLWRKRTCRSFKTALSDASVVATQSLSDGTVKEWKDRVVSPGAVEWHRKGGKLKESPKGSVEFAPEPSHAATPIRSHQITAR